MTSFTVSEGEKGWREGGREREGEREREGGTVSNIVLYTHG